MVLDLPNYLPSPCRRGLTHELDYRELIEDKKFNAVVDEHRRKGAFDGLEEGTRDYNAKLKEIAISFVRIVDDKRAALFRNRGILYGRENAFREAISCYNRALEITQNSSSRHITLANRAAAYIKIKKFAEALDDSREAAKLRPDYAIAYSLIGYCQSRLGLVKEAVINYNVALQLNPEDISSQELLKDAKKTLFGLGETPDTTETLEVPLSLKNENKKKGPLKVPVGQERGKAKTYIDSTEQSASSQDMRVKSSEPALQKKGVFDYVQMRKTTPDDGKPSPHDELLEAGLGKKLPVKKATPQAHLTQNVPRGGGQTFASLSQLPGKFKNAIVTKTRGRLGSKSGNNSVSAPVHRKNFDNITAATSPPEVPPELTESPTKSPSTEIVEITDRLHEGVHALLVDSVRERDSCSGAPYIPGLNEFAEDGSTLSGSGLGRSSLDGGPLYDGTESGFSPTSPAIAPAATIPPMVATNVLAALPKPPLKLPWNKLMATPDEQSGFANELLHSVDKKSDPGALSLGFSEQESSALDNFPTDGNPLHTYNEEELSSAYQGNTSAATLHPVAIEFPAALVKQHNELPGTAVGERHRRAHIIFNEQALKRNPSMDILNIFNLSNDISRVSLSSHPGTALPAAATLRRSLWNSSSSGGCPVPASSETCEGRGSGGEVMVQAAIKPTEDITIGHMVLGIPSYATTTNEYPGARELTLPAKYLKKQSLQKSYRHHAEVSDQPIFVPPLPEKGLNPPCPPATQLGPANGWGTKTQPPPSTSRLSYQIDGLPPGQQLKPASNRSNAHPDYEALRKSRALPPKAPSGLLVARTMDFDLNTAGNTAVEKIGWAPSESEGSGSGCSSPSFTSEPVEEDGKGRSSTEYEGAVWKWPGPLVENNLGCKNRHADQPKKSETVVTQTEAMRARLVELRRGGRRQTSNTVTCLPSRTSTSAADTPTTSISVHKQTTLTETQSKDTTSNLLLRAPPFKETYAIASLNPPPPTVATHAATSSRTAVEERRHVRATIEYFERTARSSQEPASRKIHTRSSNDRSRSNSPFGNKPRCHDKAVERLTAWVEAVTTYRYRDATLLDWLRDGSVLVSLVKAIKPEITPQGGALKPQGLLGKCEQSSPKKEGDMHTPAENLRNFFRACEELGVPKEDIFSEDDLLRKETGGLDRVVRCLEVLGSITSPAAPWYVGPMVKSAKP